MGQMENEENEEFEEEPEIDVDSTLSHTQTHVPAPPRRPARVIDEDYFDEKDDYE